MPTLLRWFLYPIVFVLGLAGIVLALAVVVLSLAYPNLPSLDILTDYHPKMPMRIYTADGYLIGEFGEERRAFVSIQDVPEIMKQAILAAEDERFYQHRGIDTLGVLRALHANLIGGGKRQGASTITQQVAKNFFLSSEKTYTRKLYEALLSVKIEHNLSKDQILELYVNQIFLGQRAYGFATAAQTYFGKPLADLTIAEAAMLAGLPKAPSAYNPVINPTRARLRQQYVLRRMNELGFISAAQQEAALAQALVIKREVNESVVHAEYVTEMARQIAAERFPDDVYTRGLRVYTTILKKDQEAAYNSLRRGVLEYDRRHGYRGAEAYVDLSEIKSEQDEALDELLQDFQDAEDLHPAIILHIDARKVRAYRRGGEVVTINGDGLRFAARMLDDKAPPTKRLRRGAVIRVQTDEKNNWRIVQMPEAEAAFLAADPRDGAVRALVGGFDFNRSQFNHATQAWRQPGSSFKPFIYSGALEKGFTPASVINDEPISFPASVTGSQSWEPKNYDGRYEGPMRMRTALAKSKNMVSIRLLQASGVRFVQDYVTRFGFDADKHPPYLTMALGAGSVTPWQMVTAYAVFANGGYRIRPYIVSEIQDDKKQVLARAEPITAGDDSLRAIDARNAYLMDSMLRDVTIYGTAARASATLKRKDLAGKTGTTNEHVDAWFCGYQQTVVGCSWIGFDQPRNLGSGETGGTAALPTWIGYMAGVLKDVPESFLPPPQGVVARASPGRKKGPAEELFYEENAPDELEPEPATDEAAKPED
ncbi:MAG TPA: penicillin-binding protein 1A [Accumulibacter sp.]|uniref:penicillin-binding protein 1A n=1 Tax=Accumulibacter sp. TaxID=2053492 RepID=UPI0028788F46|nr:penicillin-binding protein 1A [Accumulibacter sp.]MDS4056265.1 penicillin-binding protein 1A [Accumulibacter sp.]HMV04041.1 penicillin-binding protein 1A [Accumulibacter sp.]HMW63706.1 penicillin-binding protein 1A [Accumulibacter sp.]HMW80061.1 penicillin-binding protein 1A [Accumulibacter sp.]HNB66374.1 penicillin-binding protein 1A [Accumulibacter sp.]